jgi:hypothetical protein
MDKTEGAAIRQIRDFMVDFRLNDTCDPELAEFGESCRDSIPKNSYPGLLNAINNAPTRSSGVLPKARRWSAKQRRRNERKRSSRPVCVSS